MSWPKFRDCKWGDSIQRILQSAKHEQHGNGILRLISHCRRKDLWCLLLWAYVSVLRRERATPSGRAWGSSLLENTVRSETNLLLFFWYAVFTFWTSRPGLSPPDSRIKLIRDHWPWSGPREGKVEKWLQAIHFNKRGVCLFYLGRLASASGRDEVAIVWTISPLRT